MSGGILDLSAMNARDGIKLSFYKNGKRKTGIFESFKTADSTHNDVLCIKTETGFRSYRMTDIEGQMRGIRLA